MVDTFWHILTEERSDLPIRYPQRRRRASVVKSKDGISKKEEVVVEEESLEGEGWSRNTGLGQLYRGLGLRVGGSVFLFVLALWGGGVQADSGWTEI
jgi:fusion and transport protein UGO1